MNSFNHYSLGSVGEWLYRYVAGIDLDPQTAGYDRIVIRPHPGGGLTHARGEYDSIRGKIVSAWSIEGNQFNLGVTIPPNTTATVHLPVEAGARISEGGKPVEQTEGVKVLRTDDGEVVLAVGSGRYKFVGRVAQ
jgi:alpha-L-rhamnosidase